jgi:hypothetical protein
MDEPSHTKYEENCLTIQVPVNHIYIHRQKDDIPETIFSHIRGEGGMFKFIKMKVTQIILVNSTIPLNPAVRTFILCSVFVR